MPIELLPVALLLSGAVLAAVAPRGLSGPIAVLVPVLSALAAWQLLAPGASATWQIMDYRLELVRVDPVGLVLAGLFLLAALIAGIYALGQRDRLQHAAGLAYVAGGVGAVLAGDLISLFLFFELIGLSGTALVLAARNEQAVGAGIRYLVFQVGAGVALLTGILIHGQATGNWSFGPIGLDAPGAWLILLAFGIKSGFPLLHHWIVDAYPRASITGLALLLAVTTKVGIYGLLTVFPGEAVLVTIGTVMVLWPLFYTLVENDLLRALAYSMLVQLGLMVVAVGIGSDLAIDGVTLHIVMDVLFKMTLFMALGVVALRVGTTRADRLGGLWQSMPLTTVFVAIAVAANSATPLTGAFISKKLLLASIEYSDYSVWLWLGLTSLSALGVLYLGLRILWQGFLQPGQETHAKASDPPPVMLLAMLIPTALLIISGVVPALTDSLRTAGTDYSPLTVSKILGQLQLIVFAVLTYVWLARSRQGLAATRPQRWLDVDWIYRSALPTLGRAGHGLLVSIKQQLINAFSGAIDRVGGDSAGGSRLARTWPTGSMAMWVAILLAVLLLLGVGE